MIDYVKIAKDSRLSYNKFVNGYAVFNRKTNQSFFLKNFRDSLKERFYYVRDKFNLVHSLAVSDGLIPIFITSTVPSRFHDFGDIEGAYNALIKFRHDLYNNFKVDRKHVKLKNINVIEPHKSMIPHQHSIYYVSKEHQNAFLKHYYKTLKNHKFNKKGQDFKVLDSSPFAIVYLLKYIEKSMRMEDLKELGWFKYHGFRQFQTSNVDNFNLKIWRLMIGNKEHFFPNDKYDLLSAYKKLEIVELPVDADLNSIEDSSFKIYKSAVKKVTVKKVSSDKHHLLQYDNELPKIREFVNIDVETEYTIYKYFMHSCSDFYLQELSPFMGESFLLKFEHDPSRVQVIQHSNYKEVVWLG